jgi:hypothetical protein
MSDRQSNNTPEKVILAAKLFYIVIGMGFVRMVITVVRHWDVRTPDVFILSKLVLWSVSLFFVYQVSKGKNWARWIMVVMFIIAIPMAILPRISSLSHTLIPNLLGLVQVFLYVWAIVLLFQATSNAWFKEKKEVGVDSL